MDKLDCKIRLSLGYSDASFCRQDVVNIANAVKTVADKLNEVIDCVNELNTAIEERVCMDKVYCTVVSGLLEIIPKNTLVIPVSEVRYGQIKVKMVDNENVTDIFLIDDLALEEDVYGGAK